jgi:hypothetical protein
MTLGIVPVACFAARIAGGAYVTIRLERRVEVDEIGDW